MLIKAVKECKNEKTDNPANTGLSVYKCILEALFQLRLLDSFST